MSNPWKTHWALALVKGMYPYFLFAAIHHLYRPRFECQRLRFQISRRAPPCWCPYMWAPAWRLHTNLYKFGEDVSPHIFHKKNCCDLNLGESLCISTFSSFPDSGLIYWTVLIFHFDLFWIAWHWKPAIIGLFMGSINALIYTSELILCPTICIHSATRHNIQLFGFLFVFARQQKSQTWAAPRIRSLLKTHLRLSQQLTF